MAELLLQAQKALLIFLCLTMQKIDIMETQDAELLLVNVHFPINLNDALLLLNVHFLIGPKKWRVSYQLLAFILML